MRFQLETASVEDDLRRYLKEQDLELTRLEGDGEEYAWFAHGPREEQVKGLMKRVGLREYELEIMPTVDETADH